MNTFASTDFCNDLYLATRMNRQREQLLFPLKELRHDLTQIFQNLFSFILNF